MTEVLHTAADLAPLVASLADNKLYLGRRYAEWCTAAPTLESAVAAAAMAQDEIGHARSFYPVLRDIAGESPETEPETRTSFSNIPFLDEPFRGWTDFIAANFLFDTALSVLLESATESSFSAVAQRARRILEEEPLHWLHAEGWTRRLASKGEAVRRELLKSFGSLWPQTLQWFQIASPELVEAGVLECSAEPLRERFRQRIRPVLTAAGLPDLD